MIRPDSVEPLRRSLAAIPEETEEGRKLRRAEDAGFSPVGRLDEPYKCYVCGAIVHDWEMHLEWHKG